MTYEDGPTEDFTDETRPIGAPVLDLERYRPYLKNYQISEAEADAFLEAYWFILCAFARVGLGLDSVQNLFLPGTDFSSPESPDSVECEEQSHATEFKSAARDPAEKGR